MTINNTRPQQKRVQINRMIRVLLGLHADINALGNEHPDYHCQQSDRSDPGKPEQHEPAYPAHQ